MQIKRRLCFDGDWESFCNEPGRNCSVNDTYSVGLTPTSVGVTLQQWYNYEGGGGVSEGRRLPIPNIGNEVDNSDYLANPSDILQQITLNTAIGVRYYISVGFYQNNGNRYFLMGEGIDFTLSGESIDDAFIRHWNRLNRDRTPISPETYRPNTCVEAMTHVIRDEGSRQTWITYSFQNKTELTGSEVWFCEAP